VKRTGYETPKYVVFSASHIFLQNDESGLER